MGIATRLHLPCKEQEYKLASICDPPIKGSIVLHNAKLIKQKCEIRREVQRLKASRWG